MHKRTRHAGETAAPSAAVRPLADLSSFPAIKPQPDYLRQQPAPAWHVRSRSSQALVNVELAAHHQQLWNAVPVGLLIVDEFGSVIQSNLYARQLLESSSLSVDSRLLSRCVRDEDVSRLRYYLQAAFENQSEEALDVELAGDVDAESIRHVRFSVVSSASSTVMLSVTDVTEHVQLEEGKRRADERLEQLQRLESVHRMSAGIAHDFKNIVQVIESYAAVLSGQADTNNAISQGIMAASARGTLLANRWLAYSRFGQLQKQKVDVSRFLLSCMHTIEQSMPQAIHIETGVCEEPTQCQLDPCLIEQVLCNLCFNARDAMLAGGVLSVSVQGVVFDSQASSHDLLPAGAYVKFCVADNGEGILPEHLNHIFEPFFTTKEPSDGTGLGLPLVRSIVLEHQGAIEVWSEVGQGSRFTFYLPA